LEVWPNIETIVASRLPKVDGKTGSGMRRTPDPSGAAPPSGPMRTPARGRGLTQSPQVVNPEAEHRSQLGSFRLDDRHVDSVGGGNLMTCRILNDVERDFDPAAGLSLDLNGSHSWSGENHLTVLSASTSRECHTDTQEQDRSEAIGGLHGTKFLLEVESTAEDSQGRPAIRKSGGFDLMGHLAAIEKDGVLVITLDDVASLNESQAASLRQQLYTTLASRESPRVALDLSAIDYISSTGIALLIGSKRRVDAASGHLVLFGLRAEVAELFGIMKLTSLFEIASDENHALQLFPPLPSV
jgi:anti-sigma B factor antagonist